MTFVKLVSIAIITVHLMSVAGVFAEQTTESSTSTTSKPSTSTVPFKRTTNRFLSHLIRKYGSHGTISFEVGTRQKFIWQQSV